ncbi:MAG TPA: GtrA family protein [Methyloprofundus sp.]|nr:GtrA family protein [Methyloprofundus sp.]
MIELNWKTVRFIVVGVLGALVYFLCSYLFLTYTELPAYASGLLAYACSFGFAYLGQKIWAFRSVAPHGVTLVRYAVLQLFCAIFAATYTQVGVSYSHLSPLILSALATVFTGGISYIISFCWVFADSPEQVEEFRKSESSLMNLTSSKSYIQQYWRVLLISIFGLIACGLYTYLYYYMPWGVNLYAGHDDAFFIGLARSLVAGNWLGNYSQYVLMKGPGYSFFLVLTHYLGLPLYLLTAIFHCITVSFFAWVLYRLSLSRVLSILVFVSLLLLPLVISSGRIIRDQIYPDQTLLGFGALIFSLFVANTTVKQCATALLAGVMFAWLWLTREEGVWILPAVVVLLVYALWQFWHSRKLKQGLVNSVLVLMLSFSSVHLVFQFINLQVYDRFIGLDIKEKNFKAALSALQSVREGEVISHVPVPQAVFPAIYSVSPAFTELKHFFDTDGLAWRQHGCGFYPWACDEIAGGWFIWALREAVASRGYYRTPKMASDFFARVADEINKACADERLHCEKSLVSFMPEISQQQIDILPDTLEQLLDVLLLSDYSASNMRVHSAILGSYLDQSWVMGFLHSQDRFISHEGIHLDKRNNRQVFGRYAVVNKNIEKFEIVITDNQGEHYPFTLQQSASQRDINHFYPFIMRTACPNECTLSISVAGKEEFKALIPDIDQYYNQTRALVLGNMQVFFDKVVVGENKFYPVFVAGERTTLKVRQLLLSAFKGALPIVLFLGLIAFFVLTVVTILQQTLSVLYVLCGAFWAAVFARLGILLLVHISSFPAFNMLYFMPVYSLIIIASLMSLYLLIAFIYAYFSETQATGNSLISK